MTPSQPTPLPVLVIDDDSNGNQVIADTLRFRGFESISMYSGKAALEYLHDLPDDQMPRAILLDVLMPGMNGCQVLHELRHEPRTQNIPVILLSVLSQEEIREQLACACDGYSQYVNKPLDMGHIFKLVQEVVHHA